MGKFFMLFFWFLKFGIFNSRDEYSLHDYIKESFCPKYIPDEEFDDKEQLLRDTPGPAGVKYAYYVGSKAGGAFGAVIAIFALLLPVVAIALAIFFVYEPFMQIQVVNMYIGEKIFNGMHAAALGLIIAQLYRIIYFNAVKRKSLIIILPAAAIFIFINALVRDNTVNVVLIPFFIIAVIAFGILFGIIHLSMAKYREKHPKQIDPYSRKAKKMRDRQIREEEEQMRGYIDDDAMKRRREQIEEEAKQNKKHKGEE